MTGSYTHLLYEDAPEFSAAREQVRSHGLDYLRRAQCFVLFVVIDEKIGAVALWPELPEGYVDDALEDLLRASLEGGDE